MENRLKGMKITADQWGISISNNNGSYILCEIMEDCINIARIDFATHKEGKKLMDILKDLNYIFYDKLPIDIYAVPLHGDSITEKELKYFLEENYFNLHPDDTDYTLYRYK